MTQLSQKKCVACDNLSQRLNLSEIKSYLSELSDWQLEKDLKIFKQFQFRNFKSAIDFVNQVASLAESEGHHPDILVHNFKFVTISLSTHAIGGLSENDFILSAKIDQLLIKESTSHLQKSKI